MTAGILVPASFVIAARLFGIFFFAGSALDKLRNWSSFVGSVERYRLMPALAQPAAVITCLVEMLIAAGLTLPVCPFAALAGSTLLLLFAMIMAVTLLRGIRDIDCGCSFGGFGQRLRGALVVRNLLLAALILIAGAVPDGGLTTLALVDGIGAGILALIINMAVGLLLSLGDRGDAFQRRFA